MIKMMVVDLDETLLRRDKTVSAYTHEVLLRVKEAGIVCAYATARGFSAQKLVPDGVFDVSITRNGARAFMGEESIYDARVPQALLRPFLERLDALGLSATAEDGGDKITNQNDRYAKLYGAVVSKGFAILPDFTEKVYVMIEDDREIDQIQGALPEELYLHVSKDRMAMIMHLDATKANAIAAVAMHLGFGMEEVVAFGDDVNDVEMLLKCGTGVAMGNALPEVKAAADEVCATNEQDGVARWMAERILGAK